MTAVRAGDHVRIHYTARMADGSVFASWKDTAPLDFVAGGTQLIQGVSFAVVGMQVGEAKVVDVPPELAFGDHDEDIPQRVPLTELHQNVQVGDQLDVRSGERELRVWVREITDDH